MTSARASLALRIATGLTLALVGAAAYAAEASISGMWMIRGADFKNQAPPPFSQAALDYAEARKSVVIANEGRRCLPVGMPGMIYNELAVEVIESPERIAMIGEQTELPRSIYLNTTVHPDPQDVAPSWNGHSIGHWEGKVLVVDTANLNDRAPHTYFGAMPSKQTHIEERIWVEDGGKVMVNEMTITDPVVLTKPWVRTIHYERMPAGAEVWEYVCDPEDAGWTTSLGDAAK